MHWEDLPLAIYPGPERACFSGATFVEEDRVIAMYHGTKVGNMVAVSSDPLLLNWEKVTGKAVIPMDGIDELKPARRNTRGFCSTKDAATAIANGAGLIREPNRSTAS